MISARSANAPCRQIKDDKLLKILEHNKILHLDYFLRRLGKYFILVYMYVFRKT